jgi:organic hydroperoxide reductase OsmC/OhrA
MTTFETELRWKEGKQADLNARDNPLLQVATPPEFGGPARTWCPEELFVASIESCLMSTFLYFAERLDLSLTAYSSTCKGILNKTAKGLRFSGVEVRIDVAWEDDESLEKAASLRLKEKLEKYCPVSASLNCPVSIQIKMRKGARNSTDNHRDGT